MSSGVKVKKCVPKAALKVGKNGGGGLGIGLGLMMETQKRRDRRQRLRLRLNSPSDAPPRNSNAGTVFLGGCPGKFLRRAAPRPGWTGGPHPMEKLIGPLLGLISKPPDIFMVR